MARKYRGITVRGDESIQISFSWEGRRCRETLRMPPTSENLKFASNRRAGILADIERGKFEYVSEFPNSKSSIAASATNGSDVTIEAALKRWLLSVKKRHAYSTLRDYESCVYHHLIPRFGHLSLDELTRSDVEAWINDLEISPKRINNVLTPLRQVMSVAVDDELIQIDPMTRIRNLKLNTREPEPFTLQEIEAILAQLSGSPKNAVQFGFWTGLRTSELIGLRWKNVSIKDESALISEALVRGRMKEPKTKSGIRKITLHPLALDALKSQRKLHSGCEFVFFDPKSEIRWASDQPFRKRVWLPAIKKSAVRYRECYQMRHTFASQMLSQGENPMWLASHMGHSDWGMIRKIYGRWIKND